MLTWRLQERERAILPLRTLLWPSLFFYGSIQCWIEDNSLLFSRCTVCASPLELSIPEFCKFLDSILHLLLPGPMPPFRITPPAPTYPLPDLDVQQAIDDIIEELVRQVLLTHSCVITW